MRTIGGYEEDRTGRRIQGSVVIRTLQGGCDRSYRYPVRIVGSRVMQANADPSYRLKVL
jgi:hypothetical protein